jgi:hypothetical protein
MVILKICGLNPTEYLKIANHIQYVILDVILIRVAIQLLT